MAAVLVVFSLVTVNSALAPSTTPANSQWRQMGAAVATLRGGDWFTPRNQLGDLPSKGPLQAWLTVPILALTHTFSDLVYRIPSIAAGGGLALLVYLLACRWYGRRVALLAGVLWAVGMHMGHLSYLATTDMLVTFWITLSIFCADRLSFHRCAGQRDWPWVTGLWGSMILAGMTKGWGLLNLTLVGGMFAAASAVGPGFRALRPARASARFGLVLRLIGRRWGRLGRRLHLTAGMLVFLAAMAALMAVMFLRARAAFEHKLGFEIVARIFGGDEAPPPCGTPPVLALLWFAMPATVFMFVALAQVHPRGWLSRRGAPWLPLCWIASVVVPFSFTHGFRPDYLLPCYPAVAMLGAWGIDRLAGLPENARRGSVSLLRHLAAAAPVGIGLALVLAGAVYLYHSDILAACTAQAQSRGLLAGAARRTALLLTNVLTIPPLARPAAWWGLRLVPLVGAGVLWLAVKASLRWDIRRLAVVAAAGMLALQFVDQHFIAARARSGDGDKAKGFARVVGEKIGNDPFAVYQMNELATECYLGRFGLLCRNTRAVRALPGSGTRWLITTDKALLREAETRPASRPAPGAGPQLGASPLDQVIDSVGSVEYRYPDRVLYKGTQGREMLLIRIRSPGR